MAWSAVGSPHLGPGRVPSGDGTWIGPWRKDEILIGTGAGVKFETKFCLSHYSLSALLSIADLAFLNQRTLFDKCMVIFKTLLNWRFSQKALIKRVVYAKL